MKAYKSEDLINNKMKVSDLMDLTSWSVVQQYYENDEFEITVVVVVNNLDDIADVAEKLARNPITIGDMLKDGRVAIATPNPEDYVQDEMLEKYMIDYSNMNPLQLCKVIYLPAVSKVLNIDRNLILPAYIVWIDDKNLYE